MLEQVATPAPAATPDARLPEAAARLLPAAKIVTRANRWLPAARLPVGAAAAMLIPHAALAVALPLLTALWVLPYLPKIIDAATRLVIGVMRQRRGNWLLRQAVMRNRPGSADAAELFVLQAAAMPRGQRVNDETLLALYREGRAGHADRVTAGPGGTTVGCQR